MTVRWLDFLPSLTWLIFMVLPLMVMAPEISSSDLQLQVVGTVIFFLALLTGDSLSIKFGDRNRSGVSNESPYIFIFLIGLCVTLVIYHLMLMPRIPFLESLLNRQLSQDYLIELREEAGKFLAVPTGLKYIFQYVINFLGPLAFAWFIRRRNFLYAGLFAAFILFYARSSMARIPMVVFALLAVVFLWKYAFGPRLKKAFVGLVAMVSLPLIVYSVHFLSTNELSIFKFRYPKTELIEMRQARVNHQTHFSISDHYRMLATDNSVVNVPLNEPQKFVNFLVQRVFLVPSDVATRWYQYYPKVAGKHLGWTGLTSASRNDPNFEHPSHIVGMWAYYYRFPEGFHDTLHAYGSADSDLWARFGYLGLFSFFVLYIGFRWLILKFQNPTFLSRDIYSIIMILTALMLPNASVFAILISHGVAPLVLMLICVHFLELRKSQKQKSA